MNDFSLRFNTDYRLGFIEYLLLFVVLFVSFYFGMSTYAIENINEGLYAEVPREMINLGNYIIPKLNFVPYIEKPPLFYWLIALSYKIFGVSEWSARVVPASSGAMVCLSMVYFGNIIKRNREGWIAALILATSVGFVIIGRVLIFDMLLTFFFTASLLSFYIWYRRQSAIYLRFFYAFLGFAFLTKGMLALILIPSIAFLFLYSMPFRPKKFKTCFDIYGLLILFAIVFPWPYLAMKQHPGFAWDYFINEQVYRFLDKRVPHDYHTGPIYFYLPKIFLILFPWSFLALLLWFPAKQTENSLSRFLWLWFAIPFLFFSLSKAKGDYYMTVAMPPLAFLLATKIQVIFNSKRNFFLLYFFIGFSTLIMLTSGLLYGAVTHMHFSVYLPSSLRKLDTLLATPLGDLFFYSAAALCIGGGICFYFRDKPSVSFVSNIGLILILIAFYVTDKQKVEYRHSERRLANYIVEHDLTRPVYLYQDYEQISSILYYLKKRLPMINSKSQDLYYGMHTAEAKGWFYSLNDFVTARTQEKNYVVMKKDSFFSFIKSVSPQTYCVVAQSGSSILLSNQLSDCKGKSLEGSLSALNAL